METEHLPQLTAPDVPTSTSLIAFPVSKSLNLTSYVSYPFESTEYAKIEWQGDGLNVPIEQYFRFLAISFTSRTTVEEPLREPPLTGVPFIFDSELPPSTRFRSTTGYALPFVVRTKYVHSPQLNSRSSSSCKMDPTISSYSCPTNGFRCSKCDSVCAFSSLKYESTAGSRRSSSLNQNKSSSLSIGGVIGFGPRFSPGTKPNWTLCG
mmetsp:Transcript_12507/g.46734  ORF Transcript_12507/g.46734 Transcript_12507/m.46734 type:complete len:208 (+) Transcript_12507:2398-3021(+)